ncbi:Uncharacterized conserved protein YbaR, Trm112 family [Actinopolymorpha cephalotaxi]|uniref:UPF0434 protein FHR37_003381 n=1 Tax=Actinopolymorpha cephalotaxi TaxID=504797 RepID=A0A1I2KNM9_9ACTN|nr:uncharacterized protein YbaR (Trm112 family) [Actinopolymorpha cephalotaxi]SFF67860.1 Uncharacterized conserved protein YbaR, Trm112 family [Actinopolymorpha cephalotaxi]
MNLNPALLEILACPACRSPLHADDAASELVCTNAACALAYPVRDDIPVLLVDEARRPDSGPSTSGGEAAGESGSDAGPIDGNSPTATDA